MKRKKEHDREWYLEQYARHGLIGESHINNLSYGENPIIYNIMVFIAFLVVVMIH